MSEENKELSEKRQLINQGAVSVAIEKIMETDKIAQQILNKAYAHCKEIEEQTEKEKKSVIAKCEKEVAETKDKVDQQLSQNYNEHKKELDEQVRLQETNLKEKFAENKDKWIDSIYQNIINY